MLINIYIEEMMGKLRMKVKQGIKLGCETINSLRFVDDIAFCAET